MAAVQHLTDELGTLDKQYANPIDIYNKALDKLGVSDARTRVSGLKGELYNTENLIRNLDTNITGRTSGALVTEAQRQRLLASEQQPLTQQQGDVSRSLDIANTDLSSLLGQGQTQTDLTMSGYQTKRSNLLDRLKLAIDAQNTAYQRQQDALNRSASGSGGMDWGALIKALTGGGGGNNPKQPKNSGKSLSDWEKLGAGVSDSPVGGSIIGTQLQPGGGYQLQGAGKAPKIQGGGVNLQGGIAGLLQGGGSNLLRRKNNLKVPARRPVKLTIPNLRGFGLGRY